MPIEITMPRLSDTMEEGTLIKWRVNVGDSVQSGDLLADIETDKATMELQSYDDGTVAQLAVKEGDTVSVGTRILLLAESGEKVEEVVDQSSTAPQAQDQSSHQQTLKAENHGGKTSGQDSDRSGKQHSDDSAKPRPARVSPLAGKLAEKHGVDLSRVVGSGPDGRIIKRDILAAVQSVETGGTDGHQQTVAAQSINAATHTASSPVGLVPGAADSLRSQSIPVSNMRKTIARRLVESKTTIPHFTTTVVIDMEPLVALRSTLNEQLAASESTHQADSPPKETTGIKLSVNDFIVRAAALSLVKHSMVNSSWTDDGIQLHGTVNVGVAVALPAEKGGGLVVPTIRDTHLKGLRQISVETRAMAKKAREQGLTLDEMADGTFTVSNLGMFGIDHFEAIINPPQAAILAVGAAIQRPVVRDDQVVIGREMAATLSADHRVVDGAMAAQWLETFKQTLENPAVLLV